MKIICIGLNYYSHIKELQFPVPSVPLFFLKPDTAIINRNRPFFLPDFSNEIHYEVELLVRINKLGKCIQRKYAHTYYDEVGLGIDFTARDLQEKARAEGLPWELSKAFDGSAVMSKFFPKTHFTNLDQLGFSLQLNGVEVQKGNTQDMVFHIDEIISYVSQFITLKIGDIIYTGTPSGVGKVAINDRLEGFIEDEKMFDFRIK